jgi:structural maintenance of chromosome 1
VRDQKDEADEYQLKQEELGEVRTRQVLMKLWSGKKQAEGHLDTVNARKRELEGLGEEAELARELSDGKRELAQHSKDLGAAERDHLGKFKVMSNTASRLEETQAKVRGLHKRSADLNKALKSVQNENRSQQENSRGLQTQIADADRARASLQAELEALAAKGFHLDDDKLAEYNRLRTEVAGLNAGDIAEESILGQEARSKELQVSRLQTQIANIVAEERSSGTMLAEHEKRIELLRGAVKSSKEGIAAAKAEREGFSKAVEEGSKKAEALEKDLEVVKAKLADSGEQRSRSKREERLDAAIDSMQRIFTGVHGKLHNLCKPIQRKYEQAIAVTAGKHMNAVVVENAAVAQECIRYLKDQRAGTCVFLPLSTLEYKPVPERLRQYAPRYKMCIDLLECEDKYKPAVGYAVGAAMVCETLAEAQELAFTHNERVKVVTITGAVIGKSGAMTGGAVERAGENKFAEKELEQLKTRRVEVEEALADCRRSIPTRQQMVDLEIRIKSMQTRLTFSEADLKVTESKRREIETNDRLKAGVVKDLEKEIAEASKAMTTLSTKLAALRAKIADTEKTVFGAFSESIGVDNIREYERRYLRSHSDLVKKRDAASDHVAALRAQLEYQQKRDFSAAEARLSSQITEAQDLATELEGEVGALLVQEEKCRNATRVANEKVLSLRERVAADSKSIKALQVRVSEQLEARSTKATQLAKEEILLERCKKELRELMMEAQMDEIFLPTQRAEPDSDAGTDAGSSASVTQSQSNGIGLRITMTEAPSQSQSQQQSAASSSSSSSSSSSRRGAVDGSEIVTYTAMVDLSATEKKMRGLGAAALAELKADLAAQVVSLSAEVAEMRPNMHAGDRLDSVSAKLKEIESELDGARDRARAFGAQFENCRNERIQLFETCFKHVSQALEVIYRDLTKSSKHPMGGTAFLTLDDQNEPFSGGTRYTAMPPMKRFRDMEQLSGGEKTMAALALLFSIHSFRQAPFFVLDEVDAALDNVNVKKICNYIRQRSQEFQCIVISLKDALFEHADSLVGVAKDVGEMSSKVFTLDLTAFDNLSLSSDRDRSTTVDDSTTSAVDITTASAKAGGGGGGIRRASSSSSSSKGGAVRASPAASVLSTASSATQVRASPTGGAKQGKRKHSGA